MILSIAIIILIGVLIVAYYICKGVRLLSVRRKYERYLAMPGPYTGREAASIICRSVGLDAKFYITKQSSPDPFAGNVYLPDKMSFVMTRDIMDGKNLLSTCVGYQLGVTAVQYLRGELCKDRASEYFDDFALKYVFKEDEIKRYLEADAPLANEG